MVTTTLKEFDSARAQVLRRSAHGEVIRLTYHRRPYVQIAPAEGWSVVADEELAQLEAARDELDALREELEQLRSERGADGAAA
jgi:antitoxin (DNA-binding transcriptional repressor) of toxin-antitoxin stability system